MRPAVKLTSVSRKFVGSFEVSAYDTYLLSSQAENWPDLRLPAQFIYEKFTFFFRLTYQMKIFELSGTIVHI